MKYLMFLFLTSLSLHVMAVEKGVVIGFSKTPLEQALKKIEKLYAVKFTYSAQFIETEKTVDMPTRERTLNEVLDNLSTVTGLHFMQLGKLIGIQKMKISSISNVVAEPITIRGKVLDKEGQPMSGVSVNVKNRNIGTTTNSSGEFTLTVEKGDQIVFSSVGHESQEFTVVDGRAISITLQSTEQTLDEVFVTTALGIKKERRKTTYAMQEVKGSAIEKAREPNVVSTLTGRIAGLSIQTKSTMYENPDIKLRGGRTLVVIDGVPAQTDFWNINPDDVDNINVLKGTAATALYGSLGINGAIMITTKKGKAGANGIEVTFNSSNQFQAGFLKLPEAQTTYGMGWNGEYAYKDGRGGGLYDDYGYVYGPKLNVPDPSTPSGFVELPQHNSPIDPNTGEPVALPWITRSQSNLKKFLRNEFLTTNNISVAGKSDRGDYRISFTHFYQKGQVPNTQLNSSTLSMAGGLKVTDKFRIEATMSYNKQFSPNYPETGYGPDNLFYNILLWMGPEVDINDLRNYWVTGKENIEQDTYNYTWYNNPWFLAYERLRNYNADVVQAQANATYDFSKDLSFMVRTGASINNNTRTIKTPWSFINYGNSRAPNGNFEERKRNQLRIVTDALLTYKKSFLKDFNAVVSVGGSTRFDQFTELNANTNGLAVPGVYNLGNSINPVQSTNVLLEKQVNSVLGYAELSWKNQIFLNVSGRNDWSSALQKPNNSFFYPSASVGIIASEMVKLPSVISFLKFRGSWANISTDIIDIAPEVQQEYATLPVYTNGIRWNGQTSLNLPGRLISSNILPNKTISQEYGAEIRFLNNRIGADFTYYNYLDRDFVVRAPVSEASGFNELVLNGDRVKRKGIELVLSANPVRTKDFKWDVAFNYSRHRSIQEEFYGGDSIRNLVQVGGRTDVLRGWKWQRTPDGQIINDGGIPQYINAQTMLGFQNPDYEVGLTNTISYRNFLLSFQFDGRIGGSLVNGVEAKMYEGGMHESTVNSFRDDAYNGIDNYVGPGVKVVSGEAEYDAFGRLVSDTRKFETNDVPVNYITWLFASYTNGIDDAILYKRTFIKLREVVLTYSIGPKLLLRTPFKGANISVVGRNVLLFTKVPYMDPDGYSGLTLAEPSYRNIGVNLNLKF
jgi:TonB-linked SusC/RagA family outer membrane protein